MVRDFLGIPLVCQFCCQGLLDLASTPLGARGGAPVSDEPMKVALFSLGSVCNHAECIKVLLSLGLADTLQRLAASPDQTIRKYCARIQVPCLAPVK